MAETTVTFLVYNTTTGVYTPAIRVFDLEISQDAATFYSTSMTQIQYYASVLAAAYAQFDAGTLDSTDLATQVNQYMPLLISNLQGLDTWSQYLNVSQGAEVTQVATIPDVTNPGSFLTLSNTFGTMDRYMAAGVDKLVRTLRAAGYDPISNTFLAPGMTLESLAQTLFDSVVGDATLYNIAGTISAALSAVNQARISTNVWTQSQSIQQLLMVDYVADGNTMLFNEMSKLKQAIDINQSTLTYLNSLQDLMNQKDPQHFIMQLQDLSGTIGTDVAKYAAFEKDTFNQELSNVAKFSDADVLGYLESILGITPPPQPTPSQTAGTALGAFQPFSSVSATALITALENFVGTGDVTTPPISPPVDITTLLPTLPAVGSTASTLLNSFVASTQSTLNTVFGTGAITFSDYELNVWQNFLTGEAGPTGWASSVDITSPTVIADFTTYLNTLTSDITTYKNNIQASETDPIGFALGITPAQPAIYVTLSSDIATLTFPLLSTALTTSTLPDITNVPTVVAALKGAIYSAVFSELESIVPSVISANAPLGVTAAATAVANAISANANSIGSVINALVASQGDIGALLPITGSLTTSEVTTIQNAVAVAAADATANAQSPTILAALMAAGEAAVGSVTGAEQSSFPYTLKTFLKDSLENAFIIALPQTLPASEAVLPAAGINISTPSLDPLTQLNTFVSNAQAALSPTINVSQINVSDYKLQIWLNFLAGQAWQTGSLASVDLTSITVQINLQTYLAGLYGQIQSAIYPVSLGTPAMVAAFIATGFQDTLQGWYTTYLSAVPFCFLSYPPGAAADAELTPTDSSNSFFNNPVVTATYGLQLSEMGLSADPAEQLKMEQEIFFAFLAKEAGPNQSFELVNLLSPSVQTDWAAFITQLSNTSISNALDARIARILTNLQYLIDQITLATQGDNSGSSLLSSLNQLKTDFTNLQSNGNLISTWVEDYQTGSVGEYQKNLNDAVVASQALNDTQREELRRVMFVYEEFYKSATAMLSNLTQLIEKMASAIGRG